MQRQSDITSIKRRIRYRDGKKCVACGIDAKTHKIRYGGDLEVHRMVPGRKYSLQEGKCVTLCMDCHLTIHGKNYWGWVTKEDPSNLDRKVQRCMQKDIDLEREWRLRFAWGQKVYALRKNRWPRGVDESFAARAEIELADYRDLEAGRREPTLREGRLIAAALEITLEELAQEIELSNDWIADAEKRSAARAFTFRTRELQVGQELTPGGKVVFDYIKDRDEERAKIVEIKQKDRGPPVKPFYLGGAAYCGEISESTSGHSEW